MKFKPDLSFRYTSSFNTDLRKTFARVRARQRQDLLEAVSAPNTPVRNTSVVRPKFR